MPQILPEIVIRKNLNKVLWVILTRIYEDSLPIENRRTAKPFDFLHIDDFEKSSQKDIQEAFILLAENPQNVVKYKNNIDFNAIYEFNKDKLKQLAIENLCKNECMQTFTARIKKWNNGEMGGLHYIITDSFYTFNQSNGGRKYDQMCQELSDNGMIVSETSIRNKKLFLDMGIKSPSQYLRSILDIETKNTNMYITYPSVYLLPEEC